jgi:hypothetical protein
VKPDAEDGLRPATENTENTEGEERGKKGDLDAARVWVRSLVLVTGNNRLEPRERKESESNAAPA